MFCVDEGNEPVLLASGWGCARFDVKRRCPYVTKVTEVLCPEDSFVESNYGVCVHRTSTDSGLECPVLNVGATGDDLPMVEVRLLALTMSATPMMSLRWLIYCWRGESLSILSHRAADVQHCETGARATSRIAAEFTGRSARDPEVFCDA